MSRVRLGEVVLTDFVGPVRNAQQIRVGPLGLERHAGTWSEIIRIAHDRPMITMSWVRTRNDDTPAIARFATASDDVVACTPSRLELSCGERGVLIVQADSPVVWHVQAGSVAVEWTGATLCLTLASVGAGRALPPAIEAALRDARTIERAASAALERLAAAGLVIESRAEVLDRALLRARAILAFAPVAPKSQRDDARCALGALAGGDTALAGAWLRALLDNAAVPMQDMEAASWCTLAAARHLAWTGDVAAFAAAWPVVNTLVDGIVASDALQRIPFALVAVRAAALAAESIGQRERATFWRTAGVTKSKAVEPLGGSMDPGRLRELSTNPSADPAEAGHFVASVAGGLLGAEPDATRHRLRLRLRVPDGLLPFRATGLRMGEAAFRAELEGDPDQLRLEIEQIEGPVPVTLILEPWVRATAIRAILVDGRPAELEPHPEEDGWVVPVQLTLDHARRMDIERENG